MPAFDPRQDYVLEDNRALLRPLLAGDAQLLGHFAEQEPELWRYALSRVQHTADLERYIADALAGRAAGHAYPFAVYDKHAQAWAGSTRLYDLQPQHQSTQLGYTWYGRDFQGTRLNKHCKYLLLSFAFGQMGLERVEFRADARNERSIRAMKALGCTVEGILRSNCAAPSGRRDSIVLSILRGEWEAELQERLRAQLDLIS
ncbi:MAG: GNAT family N-acetyltransferase [Bacteroidia bacterium]|nr:GNAT family N-acetyltransferase [Bacteroidia bacterium]